MLCDVSKLTFCSLLCFYFMVNTLFLIPVYILLLSYLRVVLCHRMKDEWPMDIIMLFVIRTHFIFVKE